MNLGDLIPVVKIFGMAGIFGGIMLLILSEVENQVDAATGTNATYSSAASNATGHALEGGGNLMEQLPIIGTIVGLVILLGIVINSVLQNK